MSEEKFSIDTLLMLEDFSSIYSFIESLRDSGYEVEEYPSYNTHAGKIILKIRKLTLDEIAERELLTD